MPFKVMFSVDFLFLFTHKPALFDQSVSLDSILTSNFFSCVFFQVLWLMKSQAWLDSLRRSASLAQEVLERASRRAVDWNDPGLTPTSSTPDSADNKVHNLNKIDFFVAIILLHWFF